MSGASRGGEAFVAGFLFFASFLQALDNHLVAPLLPEFERTLGSAAAGRLPAAYALGAAVLPFLVAALYRRSARRLVLPALLVHGAAAVAFRAAADDGAGAFAAALARAASGAASGVLSFALLAFAAEAADPTARARRIAAQTAGFVSALVLGVPLGAWLASSFGARAPFLGVGAADLVAAAVAAVVARGGPGDDAAAAAPRTPWRALLSGRATLAGLAAVLLVGAATAPPAVRLGVRLAKEGGLGLPDIGLVYLCAGLAPIAVLPFAGKLLRAFGGARLAAAAGLCFALPAAGFALPGAAAFWPAAALFFLAVGCDVVRRTGLQSLMAEAAPEPDRARFLAFRGLVAQTGLAAGAAIAEPLHARYGFAAVSAAAVLLSAGGAVASTAAARALRGTGGR